MVPAPRPISNHDQIPALLFITGSVYGRELAARADASLLVFFAFLATFAFFGLAVDFLATDFFADKL